MNHYIYYSYEEWGRGYIGVKSSENPLTDGYFGSYTDTTFQPDHKIVIAEFSSREEAQSAEILLHEYFEVSENPHFANRCKATSTGFSCTGRKDTPETTEKRRKAQSGQNNPMYGKTGHAMPHSSESKERMKVSQKLRFEENPGTFTGRSHSEKTIRLMQAAAKGRPWSPARRKAYEEQKSKMTP